MKKNREIDKDGLNELIHLSKSLLRVFYIMTIVGIVVLCVVVAKQMKIFNLLSGILGVISPLFIGFIIAWLFAPLLKKMENKGINRILGAFLIFVGIIIVLISFVYIFIPVIYKQVNDLVSYIPTILTNIGEFATNTIGKLDIEGVDITSLKDGLFTAGQDMIVNMTSSLPNSVLGFVKSIISGIGVIVISFVIGIYMLIDFDNIKESCYKLFPKKVRDDYIKLFSNIGDTARRVVNGTLLVAFVVFVFDSIGFIIIGLNASVLLALFCGITDLIPYIGPYIGGAAAVIVGFTQGPIVGIGVLLIVVLVQAIESYVLQPVVMSKAMQLHPVLIIVGLLIFGYLFGILGMIVATPCMAVIKEIVLFIKRKKGKLKV